MTRFDGALVLRNLNKPLPALTASGKAVAQSRALTDPDELRARQRAIAPEQISLSRPVLGTI